MGTSAHEGLSEVYGTSDALTKLALGGGYIGALFGTLAGKSAWEDQEENRREGKRITNEIRAVLARRNAPILDGFRTGSFTTTRSYDFDEQPDGMVQLASAIGRDLAEYSFNKEAGIGNFVGSLMGGIGKGVGAVGKGVPKMPTAKGMGSLAQGAMQGAKNFGGSLMGGIKAAPGALGRGMQNIAQKAQNTWGGFSQNMQQRAQPRLQGIRQKSVNSGSAGELQTSAVAPNPAGPTPASALKTISPTPANQPIQAASQGQVAQPVQRSAPPPPPQQHATPQQPTPTPQPAQPPATGPAAQGGPPQPAAAPFPSPPSTPPMGQGKPSQAPPPTPQPTVDQPTTATAQAGQEGPAISPQQQVQKAPGGFDLQKTWDRTGLSNDRWKEKLPALALGGLGAYGMYRAGKGAFNWLGQESHPEQWGNPYLQPAASVNEWGVPQR